jgi:hypothetical protein
MTRKGFVWKIRSMPSNCGIGHLSDERNRTMKIEKERRNCKRVAFLRPIFYFSSNSDNLTRATMLNFCPTGICFQSGPPVTPGERLYIVTEEEPEEDIFDNNSKAIAGKVVWCRSSGGAHRVGVQYMGHPIPYAEKREIRKAWAPQASYL